MVNCCELADGSEPATDVLRSLYRDTSMKQIASRTIEIAAARFEATDWLVGRSISKAAYSAFTAQFIL